MRYILSSFVTSIAFLLVCFASPAWSGGELVEPTSAAPAEAGVPITFVCEGSADFVATYYFPPGWSSPARVTATVGGKTRDLMRDQDATGWVFADEEVWVTGAGATLVRGANRIPCKARDAPPGGGVAAAVAQARPKPPPPPKPIAFASCWAHLNARVKYYSAVFDDRVDDARQWAPAFEGFLKEKYGFNGPAQCQPGLPESDAQQYQKTLIDKDRATRTMDGQPPQIVETGWKYSKPS